MSSMKVMPPSSSQLKCSGRMSSFGGIDHDSALSSLPKWKLQSMAFREAVRAARKLPSQENCGLSRNSGPSINRSTQMRVTQMARMTGFTPSDYIFCPSCNRSFNEQAAARHIPQCKNIINKPKRLVAHTGRLTHTC